MGGRSKIPSSNLRLVKSRTSCSKCNAEKLCLVVGMDQKCVDSFNGIVRERGSFKPGEAIYRRGSSFKNLYVIQSGSAKTETETRDGRLHVTGFYLEGELMGMDSIGQKNHSSSAIALEECWVCEIPYSDLLDLCGSAPELQAKLFSRMGSRIHADEFEWNMVRNESADRRVLFFLHDLHQRQQLVSGEKSDHVFLMMSKQDIAGFLGLSPESLSRSLKRLEESGAIENHRKSIVLVDDGLASEII